MATKKKDFTKIRTAPAGKQEPVVAETTAEATAVQIGETVKKPQRKRAQEQGVVYSAIEQATGPKGQQGTAPPEEQAERREKMKTQGRKGCKAVRINLAFSDSNHAFIRVMASASGKSMTEMVNLIIAAYRREHPEIMEQAQAFLDTVNSNAFSNLLDGETNR